MTPTPALGSAIKRARERLRLSQKELAARIGVNVKTVDNWENGRTSPKSSLGALEEVLGDLQSTEEQAPPEPSLRELSDRLAELTREIKEDRAREVRRVQELEDEVKRLREQRSG